MAHPFFERITTLSTEEVTVMPMLSKGNSMLSNDGSLAMLTPRGEVLMPVKVTVETQSLVTILSHRLSLNLWDLLSFSAALDAI
jgi:hypothetical protein